MKGMSYAIKQYIVVNRQAASKWTKSKVAVQIAHASMAVLTNALKREKDFEIIVGGEHKKYACYELMTNLDFAAWIDGSFAKVVLKAESSSDLWDLVQRAKLLDIPISEIVDSGATQPIESEQNLTIAIGPFNTENPNYASLIKKLSNLKLY